jgi:PRTRC genetic system protein C
MKINIVEREFVYHGTTLPCPNPKFSIEEVRCKRESKHTVD